MRNRPLHRLLPWLTVFVLLVSAIMPVGAAAGRAGSAAITPSVGTGEDSPEHQTRQERTPLAVSVTLAATPAVGDSTTATIEVSSTVAAPGTLVDAVVSEGVEILGQSHWQVDLARDQPIRLTTDVRVNAAGNHSVSANVSYAVANDFSWGETGAAYFHSEDGAAVANYVYEGNANTGGASAAPNNGLQPPSLPFVDGTVDAPASMNMPQPPASDSGPPNSGINESPASMSASSAADVGPSVTTALMTVSGHSGYTGRDGVFRPQSLLIELLDGSFNHLAWTYSGWDGNYTFPAVNRPAQFRIRAWTYYNHVSMTQKAIRVVPQGNSTGNFEVSGYNYNVGPWTGVDGSFNVGSWQPALDWDGRRAWWIYQNVLDAFFAPYYHVPPGQANGSRLPDGVTTEWSPGSNDGAYYDYDEINLRDVDAWGAHTIVHEYGHAIMDNVYGNYFPTNDCPSPHYLEGAGGTNCSWTEGFADFWSLYVLNDPVYKFSCAQPCTPSQVDMENHTWGDYWDDGEFVEGNVAGTLWDWIDYVNEGNDRTDPGLTPFWMVWDIFWRFNHDRFSQYWAAWAGSYNTTNTRSSLWNNTIDYTWSTCPDYLLEADEAATNARSFPLGGTVNRALCTEGDTDWYYFYGLGGYAYQIETFDVGSSDTTLTLYNNAQSQVAYNDDYNGRASLITYVPATTGYHYVAVRSFSGFGSFSFPYSLRVVQDSPPTTTPPSAAILNSQTLGNPSAGVYTLNTRTTWTSTDSPEGVSSQQLQLKMGTGAYTDVSPQPSATATSHTQTFTIGDQFRFRVRAFDTLGAYNAYKTGPTLALRGYGEGRSEFAYTGSWSSLSNTNAWDGKVKTTNGSEGTKSVFSFTGRRAALVVMKRQDGGKADIYIDGVFKKTLDFYSASTQSRRIVYVTSSLPLGNHTVEVRWRSDKNASSTGHKLFIDGIVVLR